MKHLTLKELFNAFSNGLSQKEIRHLTSCEICTNQLMALYKNLYSESKPTERCSEFNETRLALYAENKLSSSETKAFEDHLLSCDYCSAAYSDLLRDKGLLKNLQPQEIKKSVIKLKTNFFSIKKWDFIPFPKLIFSPEFRGDKKRKITSLNFPVFCGELNFFFVSKKKFSIKLELTKDLSNRNIRLYQNHNLFKIVSILDQNSIVFFEDLEKANYELWLDDEFLWKGKVI